MAQQSTHERTELPAFDSAGEFTRVTAPVAVLRDGRRGSHRAGYRRARRRPPILPRGQKPMLANMRIRELAAAPTSKHVT